MTVIVSYTSLKDKIKVMMTHRQIALSVHTGWHRFTHAERAHQQAVEYRRGHGQERGNH
jgi:hypothetical protein